MCTYTFTDCAGNSHNWTYTYVIELPALTVPQTGSGIIACAGEATAPTPETLADACGREVPATPDASNSTVDIAADGHGTVTYNYTYTDCAGNGYPWQFVYTVTPFRGSPRAQARRSRRRAQRRTPGARARNRRPPPRRV